MKERVRSAPQVPDHKVLRKIGGGSYGEVWMARSVTDVMRAIKVVWRDDFENIRDFEREFEGIRNYEPISRSHAGFIPILHVGRSEGAETFYYYVMELADDVHLGQQFHPVEYTPRTLRSDLKAANQSPIDVDECLQVGVEVAEALSFLHDQGLAHRDIKPANIVYHNGHPKLADIGLVAMPGQRTFVGTEGFVPPEGPGTRRADIYSLGKVIYEMATGMDRLDFPSLPDYDFPPEKAKNFNLLNTLLCDVCEPRASHRTVFRAPQLIEALKRIQAGKKLKTKAPKKAVFSIFCLLLLMGGVITGYHFFGKQVEDSDWLVNSGLVKEYAPVKIMSDPSGAEVWTMEGEFLGTTPLGGREGTVGTYLQYEFRMDGFSNTLAGSAVQSEGIVIEANLPVFSPPRVGEIWSDALGMAYQPSDETHISHTYLAPWSIKRFDASFKSEGFKYAVAKVDINGVRRKIVMLNHSDAHRYTHWLTMRSIEEGFLTSDFTIVPVFYKEVSVFDVPAWVNRKFFFPLKCEVKRIPYGSLTLNISPRSEAVVYINGEIKETLSTADGLVVNKVRPGQFELTVEAEGFKSVTQKVAVTPREDKGLAIKLKANGSVVFDNEWRNSQEAVFVPFSDNLLVAQNETQKSMYQQFVEESQYPAPEAPEFEQTAQDPVVNVSRKDAEAYCAWLTEKERNAFLIGEQHVYRLPTDREWSAFSGLAWEEGDTPSARDISEDSSFLWGQEWPPPSRQGNFADLSAALSIDVSAYRTINGYQDHYINTAPVGSFVLSERGLNDMAGNVYEWVSGGFGVGDYGVTRGGSWKCYQPENLYRKFRNAIKPNVKNDETGFRIVLSKSL